MNAAVKLVVTILDGAVFACQSVFLTCGEPGQNQNPNIHGRAQDTRLLSPPLTFLAGECHKPLGYALACHFYTGGWQRLLSHLHSQCLHK